MDKGDRLVLELQYIVIVLVVLVFFLLGWVYRVQNTLSELTETVEMLAKNDEKQIERVVQNYEMIKLLNKITTDRDARVTNLLEDLKQGLWEELKIIKKNKLSNEAVQLIVEQKVRMFMEAEKLDER